MATDPLVAAFNQAESMARSELLAFYRANIGRGLVQGDADLFGFVAAKLGIKIVWQSYDLQADAWSDGRREDQ